MSEMINRVREKTTTSGTGSVSLDGGVATPAFLSMVEAGAVTGHQYTFCVEENTDFEIFRGTYTSGSPGTVTRDQTLISKISGTSGSSNLPLLGNATIRVIQAAEDIITKQQAIARIIALS